MAQTTFNDNVLVDGSQDIQQLRVQSHSTQNQPLQTWETSAGVVQSQITGDGRVVAGDDLGVATPDALLEVHRAEASTTRPRRGIHSLGQISGTLNSLLQWMVAELEVRGSSALDALHTGLRVRTSNLNTGTPTANAELRGADVEVIQDATAASAALPRATGLQVGVTNAAGKTITEAAALRLKLNNAGTITNPYSIFAEGPGVAHFEDYLEVKRPAVVPGTPPTDFMRLYPKSDGKLYAKNWSGAEVELGGGSGSAPIAGICNGRLTLSSGVPIPVTDVTAASTLYFTPFKGNQVALFNGTTWSLFPFTERSLSLSGLLANTVYDIFIYDNGGTLTLEAVPWVANANGSVTSIATTRTVTTTAAHGLAIGQLVTIAGNSGAGNNGTWRVATVPTTTTFTVLNLNNSTPTFVAGTGGTWQRADQSTGRVTNLAAQDGIFVKSGTPQRRYLGTIRTLTSPGQSQDSRQKRFVYNEYNQLTRPVSKTGGSQYTYSAAGYRPAGNNMANRVEVVIGNLGPLMSLNGSCRITSSVANVGVAHGIGYDRFNNSDEDLSPTISTDGSVAFYLAHHPDIGYHYYQWVEDGRGAAGTMTHYPGVLKGGIAGMIAL